MPRRRETTLTVRIKAFLKLSTDTTMLIAPFGYPHPGVIGVPPFLLTQNISPKYITRSDIMKVPCCRYDATLRFKGLKCKGMQTEGNGVSNKAIVLREWLQVSCETSKVRKVIGSSMLSVVYMLQFHVKINQGLT